MNNINVTVNLSAEDRARLDRLAEALEKYPHKCENCAKSVAEGVAAFVAKEVNTPHEEPKNEPQDPVKEKAPATDPAEKEKPADETEPAVTLEQIQQKVIQLAAGNDGAKKAKVREIINAYAKKVSDLPEDKWSEVWAKLTALESEA